MKKYMKLSARKDEFISFASHELKTPLTTISGYLQLVESSPDLASDFLPRISKQVKRLSAIIGDLLDISKMQAAGPISILRRQVYWV
ncbi:MAG: histidine kinase dimerization/phospho-acceptor domain-containing protein [Bacteroidota bacterium]